MYSGVSRRYGLYLVKRIVMNILPDYPLVIERAGNTQ